MNNPQKKKEVRRTDRPNRRERRSKVKNLERVTKSDLGVSRSVTISAAQGRVARMAKAKIVPLRDGDVRVTHREYVQDINGSVAFAASTIPINPGLQLFPWLSQIAPRWESYKFNRLRFCFETESANTTTGTVLLAVDYDPSDAAPETKAQAMAYRSSVRSPPWSDCCHESLLEDLGKLKSFFVRTGTLAANQDIKLYDTGNLYVCTIAQANANLIGELYIEYDVTLMTPQLGPISSGGAIYGSWESASSSNAAPFGSTLVGNLPATISYSGTTLSVTTITFTQAWSGLVAIQLVGTGLTALLFTGTGTIINQYGTINLTQDDETTFATVTVAPGQTVIFTNTNTTISSGGLFFGQGVFV